MKIENKFTMGDVDAFMDTYRDRERHVVADRLQRISDRLVRLAPHIKAESSDAGAWNAHEILAHIAVTSKFYGVMVHRIASGKMTEIGLVDSVNLRDVAGKQMSELAPEEVARTAVADQQRTIETLRHADLAALRRTARLDDGTTMTAEEIARLPLVSHLEAHLEDLEKLVSR